MKNLETGYKKDKKRKIKKHKFYVSSLVHRSTKDNKITLSERIIKFFIWLALRATVKPKKWRESVDKNFEIIDRTYKKLISADFIFIPSSIAFYIIMSFIPVLALISFASIIPVVNSVLSKDNIKGVIGDFIPGISDVLDQLEKWRSGLNNTEFLSMQFVSGSLTIFFSLLISVWIGSVGMSKLIYTQSYIYEQKFSGGYWTNRFKGMFMILILTIGLIGVLIFNIYVIKMIKSWNIGSVFGDFFKYLFLVFGLLILLFFGMISLFKFSPSYKIKIRHVIPGAMVTALPTSIFLSLFPLITAFWNYGKYGTIGVIMYIGTTALILTNLIFLGLIANASYYKTFVGITLKKKKSFLKK